MLKSKQHRF